MVSKIGIIESLVFLGFTLGIFLPVRLITFYYLTDWWFGSFGMITITLVIILYLVKKGKLGWVGRIWQKKLNKIAKGKLGLALMIQSIIFILMFGSIVYLTDVNRGTEVVEVMMVELEAEGVDDFSSMMVNTAKATAKATPMDYIMVTIFLIENPEILGQFYAIFDDLAGGWHQHLNMVWFVEEIEALCLILYFRYKRDNSITEISK